MRYWQNITLIFLFMMSGSCARLPVAEPTVLSLDIINRYRITEEALKKIPVRLDKKLVLRYERRIPGYNIEREKLEVITENKAEEVTFAAKSKGWIVAAGKEGNFLEKVLDKEIFRIYVTFEDTSKKPPATLIFRPNLSNGFELETQKKYRRRYTKYNGRDYLCVSGFEANALLVNLETVKQVSETYRTIR